MPSLDHLLNPRCMKCGLCELARTVCLGGNGNPKSKLFLVGEAPGRDEDALGIPFVGAAGQLLNDILVSFDLKRKDVFVSNAVKCRPPDNKTPLTEHILACRSYLIAEILEVKPTIVLALGVTAMRSLLNLKKFALGENRGAIFQLPEDKTISILCTYHPAAIKRDADFLKPTIEDFERVLKYLEHGIPEKREGKYFKGVAKPTDKFVIDLETSGLDMFAKDGDILCVGTTDKAFKGYAVENIELAEPIIHSDMLKIGHNIKFDAKWLAQEGYILHGPWFDTMIAAHMLDENLPSYGLKELVLGNTDLGRYAEKMERAVALVKKDYRKVPSNIRNKYCAMDVDATMRLYDLYEPRLREEGLLPLFKMTMRGAQVMANAEYQGVAIDHDRRQYLETAYRKKLDRIRAAIKDIAGIKDLNPGSPTQLGRLLTGKMGFPIIRRTKEGKVAVDKDVLAQLLPLDKSGIIAKIQQLRLFAKMYSMYLGPKATLLSDDGKCHAGFKIHGTDTGRYSCVEPNLQQVPKKSEIKSMFTSKYHNGKIVQIDYDQGELRMLAQYSHDPVLLKTFQTGVDIHEQTAASIFGIPVERVTEEQRATGKTINFALLYGIGDEALGHRLGVLPNEAAKLKRAYFKKHGKVDEYIKTKHKEIIEEGYVTSLYGRKRRIVIPDDSPRYVIEGAQRKAANAPIQGALHDTNVNSMVAVSDHLASNGFHSHVIMEIHDAVYFDCPEDEAEEVVKIVEEIFPHPKTKKRFGFKFDIPLPVQVSSGFTWKEASDRG